jgi:hypothetical protein
LCAVSPWTSSWLLVAVVAAAMLGAHQAAAAVLVGIVN